MVEYEIIEVPEPVRSTKPLASAAKMDGLYRGSLYNPQSVNSNTVTPARPPKHKQPEYWKNGLPFMFPGAARLRKQIKAERRKAKQVGPKKAKGISDRNKPVAQCPVGTERHNEHYRDRDSNLKYLGFASYREYLKSDLWARTKSNGFKLKGNQCCLCKLPAPILHHHSYNMDVLRGENLLPLFPMCNACHQSLEMKNGRKRPMSLVQANFRKLLKQAQRQ